MLRSILFGFVMRNSVRQTVSEDGIDTPLMEDQLKKLPERQQSAVMITLVPYLACLTQGLSEQAALFRNRLESLLGFERVGWIDVLAETARAVFDSRAMRMGVLGAGVMGGAMVMQAAADNEKKRTDSPIPDITGLSDDAIAQLAKREKITVEQLKKGSEARNLRVVSSWTVRLMFGKKPLELTFFPANLGINCKVKGINDKFDSQTFNFKIPRKIGGAPFVLNEDKRKVIAGVFTTHALAEIFKSKMGLEKVQQMRDKGVIKLQDGDDAVTAVEPKAKVVARSRSMSDKCIRYYTFYNFDHPQAGKGLVLLFGGLYYFVPDERVPLTASGAVDFPKTKRAIALAIRVGAGLEVTQDGIARTMKADDECGDTFTAIAVPEPPGLVAFGNEKGK
jgi:hypothetical protein